SATYRRRRLSRLARNGASSSCRSRCSRSTAPICAACCSRREPRGDPSRSRSMACGFDEARTPMMYAPFTPSEGNFTAKLFETETPSTVANCVGLAEGTKDWTDPRTRRSEKKPLYDGTIFHRVIDGFMIQGGDPLGNGTGGPGFRFADEFHPKL